MSTRECVDCGTMFSSVRAPRCRPCYTTHWVNRDPEAYRRRAREKALKHRFGMSQEDYDRMHQAQQGRCAICLQPEQGQSRYGRLKTLAVDHSHVSGAVRGLLCFRCNTVVGSLGEDPQRADAVARYLRGEI